MSVGPSILDGDGATFDPTKLSQPLDKSSYPLARSQTRGRSQEPDGRQLASLLCARRERPRNRCAAEQRDELAPPHSITSSARASSVGGTSRPSVFAVLRLMTSSILVGACTGKSAGFSPLKIRST